MDPVQAAVAALLNAIQAAQASGGSQATPASALSALAGKDITLLFQGTAEGGLQFTLPSGQTFTAQGNLAYPEGTRLTVRVAPTAEGGFRLQTLQAQPPAAPAILAPLAQGEAQVLLARLTTPDPPPELGPLVQLFRQLAGQPPEAPPQAPSAQVPVPSQQAAPQPAAPQQAVPQQAAPQQAAPQQATPQQAAPQQAVPQQVAPQPAAPQPAAPQPAAPQPAAPQPAAPQQAVPQQAAPQSAVLQQAAPQQAAPQQAAPQQAAPQQAAPQQAAPQLGMPQQAAPQQTTPPQVATQPAAPQPTVPQQPTAQPAMPQVTLLPPTLQPPPTPHPSGPLPSAPQALAGQAVGSQPPASPGMAWQPEAAGQAAAPPAQGPPQAPSGGAASAAQVPLPDFAGSLAGLSPQPPNVRDLIPLLRDLPQPEARALLRLLQAGRTLDEAPVQEAAARLQAALPRRAEGAAPEPLAQALKALARNPEALHAATAGAAEGASAPRQAAAAPESWEAWIRSSVRTLGDPAVSPREAPFHLAQAREGTAYFELPLPWAPQAPLQMWVERDRQGQGRGAEEDVRVLLGLSFTRLGETRLGIRQAGGGLQVRLWAQHPGPLEAARQEMERELAALGRPVDLKVLPLDPEAPVPSIRSLAAGSSFQALG